RGPARTGDGSGRGGGRRRAGGGRRIGRRGGGGGRSRTDVLDREVGRERAAEEKQRGAERDEACDPFDLRGKPFGWGFRPLADVVLDQREPPRLRNAGRPLLSPLPPGAPAPPRGGTGQPAEEAILLVSFRRPRPS